MTHYNLILQLQIGMGVIQGNIDSEELTDWIEEHSKVI